MKDTGNSGDRPDELKILRPCIECGEVVENAARCDRCRNLQERHDRRGRVEPDKRPREIGYDAAWDRLSRQARKLSPFCEWCGSRSALTADHLRWPARTVADVRVLCRSCNSRAGARTLARSDVDTTGAEGGREPGQARSRNGKWSGHGVKDETSRGSLRVGLAESRTASGLPDRALARLDMLFQAVSGGRMRRRVARKGEGSVRFGAADSHHPPRLVLES